MKTTNDETSNSPNFHRFVGSLQSWIEKQWITEEPRWFITIQWTPAPYRFEKASGNAMLFKNKLLCFLNNSCSPRKIPDASERPRLIWFHERVDDSTGHLIYHSHLHLTALPEPYSTKPALTRLISQEIAPGFRSLKNLNRSVDPAIVILDWNRKNHSSYNLKDYYTYKHSQDPDLILDNKASDLLSY